MDNKELKSYIHASPEPLIFGFIVLAMSLPICITLIVNPVDPTNSNEIRLLILVILLILGMSSVGFLIHFISILRRDKILSQYETQYGVDALNKDFNSARSELADQIRLGDNWLYGRNTGMVIRYEQISRIYTRIERTDTGIEQERSLRIETLDGQKRKLCTVPTKGILKKQNHPDLEAIIKELLIKNPSIRIGR